MATVGASLKLFDQFSNTLNRAQQSMNSTIIIADRLRHSLNGTIELRFVMNSNMILTQVTQLRSRLERSLGVIRARIRVDLPVQLTSMFQNLQSLVMRLIGAVRQLRIASGSNAQQLQDALQRIARLEQQILELQGGLNNRIREGTNSSGGLLGNLKGIASAYLSIAAAKKLWEATVGGAMEQQKMQDMFKARTGDDQVGAAMFQKFKQDALKTGAEVKASLTGALSFFSMTRDTNQITQLNNIAQRLAAFDTTGQGLDGGVFSVKEAMSGDIISLAERFNMSKAQIRSVKLDELGKSGDIEGFIKAFNKLLEMQSMGQAAFDKMLSSPAKQSEILRNNLKSMFADAGQKSVEALLPVILLLNQAFQEGKFNSFFIGLSSGLAWVVNQAIYLFNVATDIYEFISGNWGNIEPIIWGIVAAFVAWRAITLALSIAQAIQAATTGTGTLAIFIQTLAVSGLAAAWGTLNAVMKANVIILIISIIIGLIVWVIKLWKTNDDFAAGLIRAWNSILNFFDRIPVYFWQLAEAMLQPFVSWAKSIGGIYDETINGIIGGINKVLGLVNKLTGSQFEIGTKFNMEDFANKALDFASGKKELAFAAAETNAFSREQKVLDMLNNRSAMRAANDAIGPITPGSEILDRWNQNANIDRVNEVGKIDDTVDISNEDLKVMRELAEMKSIQNFITLTPTVQLTGDIHNHEASDVEDMVGQLVESLRTQMAVSVDGVISP
ncbi:hypothetical protein PAECIP111891_02188 [Paenibacillus allorhizoplanae]|uniref:Phage tail tape measure protein n=2 Tax=Paenibacillus allorhizoplanae TaxID=2905648 RepID=A0ABN8G8J0_9BACL|nr:hypothetical protein PAECIP111891_02188 [Paenibacillus allorhizoplanae]